MKKPISIYVKNFCPLRPIADIRSGSRILWLILLAGLFWGSTPAQAKNGELRYITLSLVFLDRGSLDGLKLGQTLDIRRQDEVIATLEIIRLSDHSAAAKIVTQTRPLLVHDQFHLPESGQPSPPLSSSQALYQAIAPQEIAQRWQQSFDANPVQPVQTAPSQGKHPRNPAFLGRASTTITSRSVMSDTEDMGNEQRFSLWLEARHLGLDGLSMKIRGDLDVRYDDHEDEYLSGKKVIPLVRSAFVRYATPRDGLWAEIGRIYPDLRAAGLVDGSEVGWASPRLNLSAFVGLRPNFLDLSPQTDGPTFGGSAGFFIYSGPGLSWEARAGYLADIFEGELAKSRISLDNTLRLGRKATLLESATVDILVPDGNLGEKSGLELSDLDLNFSSVLTTDLAWDTSLRYNTNRLFVSEAAGLPAEWDEWLKSGSFWRADSRLAISLNPQQILRPYVFGERDDQANRADAKDTTLVGVGLGYDHDRLLGSTLGLTVAGDYGYNGSHRANADVQLDWPLSESIRTLAGIQTFWTMGQGSSLHYLEHLLNVGLQGTIREHFRVWLNLLGVLDHNATSSFETWYLGRLSAGYEW